MQNFLEGSKRKIYTRDTDGNLVSYTKEEPTIFTVHGKQSLATYGYNNNITLLTNKDYNPDHIPAKKLTDGKITKGSLFALAIIDILNNPSNYKETCDLEKLKIIATTHGIWKDPNDVDLDVDLMAESTESLTHQELKHML